MNRNPAKPKPLRIMRPCTCASRYVECNCAYLRTKSLGAKPWDVPGYFHIPLMVLAVCVVIVGTYYLFGG